LSASSTTGPSVLISGSAGALINATTVGAFGPYLRCLELNGANVGLSGVLMSRPGPSTPTFELLNVHHFTGAGLNAPSGLGDLRRSFINSNGGDGVVWGSDGNIDEYTEVSSNGGAGIHVLYGGSRIRAEADFNGGPGIWVDGTIAGHFNTFLNDCYVDDNKGANIKISGTSVVTSSTST
jgi:hypothetical protein